MLWTWDYIQPGDCCATAVDADVLLSTDGCATVNDVGDAGLERGGSMHHNFNTGEPEGGTSQIAERSRS